jgi:hypothetical protein
MHRSLHTILALAFAAAGPALAQSPVPLAVGDSAPDFTLPVATGAGVGAAPLHLHDLRDQTIVLAFFYRARSSG